MIFEKGMPMTIINFDNSATSFPKPASVKNAALTAMTRYGGNPGRGGHKLSMETASAVYRARQEAADFFGSESDQVVFALNCTHALNMAIKGVMQNFSGGHIIISSLEHNSVLRPVHALSTQGKCTYSVAQVSHDDNETIKNIKALITPKTKVIAFTLGSNVTGQITPYKKIAELCRINNICFIADGAQVCGIIPIKLSDGINIICTAGHKALYGPTGTGLLITDGKYEILPIMEGGTGSTSLEPTMPEFLPDSLESGTINTVGAISLGAGIKFVNKTGIDNIFHHELMLCERFISGISQLQGVTIYRDSRVSSYLPVVSFNIDGNSAHETASLLSDKGFALRGGLHCSGLAHNSIGTAPEGTVRFSPSVFNNEREVDMLVNAISVICRTK